MNKKIFLSVLVLLFAFSCDSFKKVQENNNAEYRYEMALKYYDKKDYDHASELLKELMTVYRGTAKMEEIYYRWSYCDYHLEDYLFAAHQFRRFVQAFPRSKYTEELQYMIGVCYVKYSSAYYLDQEFTSKAIDELQLYLDKYPKGTYSAQANEYVDKMQQKLETKGFEAVKLYYKIGEYKACMVTGESFCEEFPDSKLVEKVRLMMVESSFNYAEQSVEEKQLERYKDVVTYADKFLRKYPESKKVEDVLKLKEKSVEKQSYIRYRLPLYYYEKADYAKAIKGFEDLLKSTDFASKHDELMYYLLKSQYLYAQTVEPDRKAVELEKYKTLFKKEELSSTFSATTYYKELKRMFDQADKTIAQLPSLIGKEYYDLLNFEKAAKYYFAYAEQSANVSEKQKYAAEGIESKLREAEKAGDFFKLQKYNETIEAYQKWESVLSGSFYENKAKVVYNKALANKEMYPLALYKAQFDKKQYNWIQLEAKKNLADGKLGVFQDEIVYLWALSAYKQAEKSEKYERKAQLSKALELVVDLKKLSFKSTETLKKLEDLEVNINGKIEKLNK